MRKSSKLAYVAVRLAPETVREIKRMAKREQRKASQMHRALIEEAIQARRQRNAHPGEQTP